MLVLLKTKLHDIYICSIYGYCNIHGTVQTLPRLFNVYFENGCQLSKALPNLSNLTYSGYSYKHLLIPYAIYRLSG